MAYRLVAGLLEPLTLLWLLTAIGVASLWRRPRQKPGRLTLATVGLLILSVACTRACAYLALGSLEWPYPPRFDRPEDLQAIVVLSGYVRPPDDVWPEAELGADTLRRCLHAARLYRQGNPCRVVVSGGAGDPPRPGPTSAEAMAGFLRGQGVAASDLILEGRSTSTYENAVHTSSLLRERGIDKVLLVTDAAHLLRAQRCFRAQGIETIPSGCRYRARGLTWSPLHFLPSPNAAVETRHALHEWVGMLWYWLHGRI